MEFPTTEGSSGVTATINPVIDDLVVAVGRNCHIITDPDITAGYRQDQTLVVPGGEPLLVAFPRPSKTRLRS